MKDPDSESTSERVRRPIDTAIQLGVIALLGYSCFLITKPFIGLVVWGAIISVAIYPLFEKLGSALGQRTQLAATLIAPMRRTLLLGIVWILLPVASGADVFDDGLTHDVDFTLLGISMVLDSAGGDPTTVNMRSGADATLGALEVQDSSVLNVFSGAVVDSPDYFFTSSGAICGGSIQQLLMNGAPVVEVNGGTFISGPGAPLRLVSGTLTVQGGSFENTGAGTVVAVELSSGVAEIRGGTLVHGIVRLGGTMQATISGGSYGSNAIQNLLGGTLTIVGTSFNLPFGPVALGGIYNGPLTGTLADGSAIDTTLLKSSSSSVTLVDGTQGPLTSTVCDPVPSVPALPDWAIGLVLIALAATGAVFAGNAMVILVRRS